MFLKIVAAPGGGLPGRMRFDAPGDGDGELQVTLGFTRLAFTPNLDCAGMPVFGARKRA